MKKSYILIIGLLFSLSFISSQGLINPTKDVNVYQGNLTNLSQMYDTQITNPQNGHTLGWNSALGKWVNGFAEEVLCFIKGIDENNNEDDLLIANDTGYIGYDNSVFESKVSGFISENLYNKTEIDSFEFYNQSNFDTSSFINITGGTITGNLTVDGYYFGYPIDGGIDSGVIYSSSIDAGGNVNVTIDGLSVTYPDMILRIAKADNSVVYCTISSDTIVVSDNSHTVYYVDSDCNIQSSSIADYLNTDISPGGSADFFNAMAHSGNIETYKGVTVLNKVGTKVRRNLFKTGNLEVVSGLNIAQDVFPNFTISSGEYTYLREVVDTTERNITEGNSLELISKSAGDWTYTTSLNGINLTHCNDGTNTVECSNPTLYRRYFILITGFDDGSDTTEVHQLLADNNIYYTTLANCLDTTTKPLNYSLPAIYSYTAVPIYAYCGRASESDWTGTFIDLREVKTGQAQTDVDTTIFLTKDGLTELTGNWNAGTYNITAGYFLGKWNGSEDYYLINNPFGYYNSTNFDINNYYLASNPFGFYNSTDFSISDYYLASNPFGFYNSTNPQTETDPMWTANFTLYNSTWSSGTEYSAGTNMTLVDTVFSVNMTGVKEYFDLIYQAIGTYLTTASSFGGDVSGTYDNLQLAENSVGDNEIDYTEVKLGDFENDAGFITDYTETDPMWTDNKTNVAFTNKAETFTSNVTIQGTIHQSTSNIILCWTEDGGVCLAGICNNGTHTIYGNFTGATGC